MFNRIARPVLSLTLLLTFLFAAVENAQAQSDVLAEIENLTPREHRQDGFILASAQTIEITATGAEPRNERRRWDNDRNEDRDLWPANAWILNAETRQVVWDLQSEETDRARNGLRKFEGSISLPAGSYEVHYASFVATSWGSTFREGISSIFRRISEDSDDNRYGGHYVDNDAFEDFQITISGTGNSAGTKQMIDVASAVKESAIISISPYRSSSDRFGFELESRTDFEVLAIGEMDRDGRYDYGWIQDIESGSRVWEMDYYDSAHAGGADKNRIHEDIFTLEAGRYVAYFVADDSHDPDEWNSVPPFDTAFWGLTLWALENEDGRADGKITTFEYEPVSSELTFASLTHMRDDEMESEGFSLASPMSVNIYALGEGTDGNMVDYAWIIDNDTRQRIWTMDFRGSEHAGGSYKNRLSAQQLHLDSGNYRVYYRTDGSHSYGDWNDSPPADEAYWGVSLSATNESDLEFVGPLQRLDKRSLIAQLVEVGDDEREREYFELEKSAEVRIIALGEGDSGEMYDTAWIENRDNGRTVWEMTYRNSEHAGGARKNRMFSGVIQLPAGEYVVRYASDGSHSYEDWNSDAPDSPEMWGVTLLLED